MTSPVAGRPAAAAEEPGAPVVSVVVPAHNAAAFLDGALESALGQTCRALEVIAVDDASTDGTHAALLGWRRRDPRVVVLRQERRQGPGAARNLAIGRARGRWIAPLDADDAFLPERLERLVAGAEAAGADLLADNLLLRDFDRGTLLGPCMPEEVMARPGPLTLAEMLRLNRPDAAPGQAKLGYLKPILRRDFLRRAGLRYRPEIRVGEDFLFYFECVAAGGRFLLAPEALYLYAVRPGSASSGGGGAFDFSAALRHMRRAAADHRDAGLHALLRERRRVVDADCFELSVTARRPGAALRYALTADAGRVARRLRSAALAAVRRAAGAGGPPPERDRPGPEQPKA